MNVYAFFALLAFFSYLALGFFVLLLDSKKSLNRIFFFYSLAAAAYSFAEFGYLQAESYETAWIYIKSRSIWPFTFATALHFHLIFTRKSSWLQNPFNRCLLYFPASLIFVVDLFTPWITGIPVLKYGIWSYQTPDDTILPLLSGLFALTYMLLMSGLVLNFYLRNQNKQPFPKSYAAYILGADLLVIFIVIINTFLQQIPDFEYTNVDSALLLFTNVIIAYAIWRFSLSQVSKDFVYEEIVTYMSEFLFLVNPDGRINAANELALEITGFSEEELENWNIKEVFDSGDHLENYDWFDIAKNSQIEKEGTLLCKGGKTVAVSYSVIRLPLQRGNEMNWAYMGKVLKQAEEIPTRKKLTQPLAINGKTPLNQLIKVINHDLAEGTRLIHLCTQMVEYDKLEQKLQDELLFFAEENTRELIKDYLNRNRKHLLCIKDEALLLRQKLKALGDYAAADYEKKRVPVDLKKMVELAFAQCIRNPEQLNLKISIGKLPVIEAVPEQILRLLRHLISNAVKFRRKNEFLHIQVHMIFQDIKSYIIEFRDNGIGISPDYHQGVFEIFHQLNKQAQYEGVGIGLPICKKIVESHKGDIWIKPDSQQGTAVCISLPV